MAAGDRCSRVGRGQEGDRVIKVNYTDKRKRVQEGKDRISLCSR